MKLDVCYACAKPIPDELDNALIITLDGGYGMFVESDSFMLHSEFWTSLGEERQRALYDQWLTVECKYEGGIARYEQEYPGSLHLEAAPMPLPESVQDEFRQYVYENRHHKVIICHECAHDLCATIPWFNRLIEPHNSHSHNVSYIEAHPEHWGWDYDSRAERSS